MPTTIEGNIEALSKSGNNIFPITTPRAIIEEGSDRNLLDMLEEANRIPTAAEIGARPADWMPTAEEVGARPDTWMPTAEEVGAASVGMISNAWSAATAYSVGDYCLHNDTLWRCKVANTGVAPVEGSYWGSVTAGGRFQELDGLLNGRSSLFGFIRALKVTTRSSAATIQVKVEGTAHFVILIATNNNTRGSLYLCSAHSGVSAISNPSNASVPSYGGSNRVISIPLMDWSDVVLISLLGNELTKL